MKKFLGLIRFVNLFLTGLLTGHLLSSWWGPHRVLLDMSPTIALTVEQAMIENYTPLIGPLMATTVITAGLILLFNRNLKSKAYVFNIIGLLGVVGMLLTTLLINVPINSMVESWTLQTLPPDFMEIRERWITAHVARGIFCTVAFLFQLGAVFTLLKEEITTRS